MPAREERFRARLAAADPGAVAAAVEDLLKTRVADGGRVEYGPTTVTSCFPTLDRPGHDPIWPYAIVPSSAKGGGRIEGVFQYLITPRWPPTLRSRGLRPMRSVGGELFQPCDDLRGVGHLEDLPADLGSAARQACRCRPGAAPRAGLGGPTSGAHTRPAPLASTWRAMSWWSEATGSITRCRPWPMCVEAR
jgi:hypothetical protein